MLLATFRQFASNSFRRHVSIFSKGAWLRRLFESDGNDDKDISFNDVGYDIDNNEDKDICFNDYDDYSRLAISGGGLHKSHYRLKEDQYFTNQNLELLSKLRDSGNLVKCTGVFNDWGEFKKTLSSCETAAIRETGSLNKHKNCMEEAYFLGEQQNCVDLFRRNTSSSSSSGIIAAKVSPLPSSEDSDIVY